jgi:nicotinate phosphoribosyltransferase
MSDRKTSLLATDLYEITMAAAFFENNFNPTASFELFVRRLPKERGYLVAAGLEQALSWLERARFSEEDVAFLRKHPAFTHVKNEFFETLLEVRFSGDVWALPEGTLVFAEEPILRITAPLIEAQIVETNLLAIITFQTMIATKASRVVAAAQGKEVIEFGARRAHGPEAGLFAARAAYLGGCIGTSNVAAGRDFGIPTFGTMAHSFVMAIRDEELAFQQYATLFPETSVLLIDTYDTLAAVDNIIAAGMKPTGVRLDSGDLAELSREVRRRLDAAGLCGTKILLSGDLDEHKVEKLLEQGTPADGFGVGTSLVVSNDAPALGGIYKLVEIQNGTEKSYHAKFSADKATYPGTKQVYRFRDGEGMFARDLIACSGERVQGGEPLLQPMMRNGQRLIQPAESLQKIRDRVHSQLKLLPEAARRSISPVRYEVKFSAELERLLQQVKRERAA